MKQISRLRDIIDQYDTYLIDVSGVIHDGLIAYPYSIDTLNQLQKHNKKIIFFSNSPRPADTIQDKLEKLGFKFESEDIACSRDFYLYSLKNKQNEKQKIIIYGEDMNPTLNTQNLTPYYEITDDISQADKMLPLWYLESDDSIDRYEAVLLRALKYNVTFICTNPDKIANHGNTFRYPAGMLANMYEKIGGMVEYYGKPYIPFYEYALKDITYDKTKILAIGDNLDTDILGANSFGVESLLVKNGIYKDVNNFEDLISNHLAIATYIFQYFEF